MKTLLITLIIMSMLLTQGCVMAIKDDFVYIRWGNQTMDGLELTSDPNEIHVKLTGQQSELDLLKYGIELGKGLAVMP